MCGAFDEMVGGYERSMSYSIGGISITSSMSPLIHPMWDLRLRHSYYFFPVQIKLARLIVATNIKLPHIRYEAELFIIIESIALSYQMLNIAVQHLLGTCGISICLVCSISYH